MRDLMFSGQLLAAATFKHFEIFALVAIIYFLISYPTAKRVDYIEGRLDVHKVRGSKPMHV
jgi:ABC-type amino acid transport system permease subunit